MEGNQVASASIQLQLNGSSLISVVSQRMQCAVTTAVRMLFDALQAPRSEPSLHPRVRRVLDADPLLAAMVKENPRLLRKLQVSKLPVRGGYFCT